MIDQAQIGLYFYLIMGGSCVCSFNQITAYKIVTDQRSNQMVVQSKQDLRSDQNKFIVLDRVQHKMFPYKLIGAIICNRTRLGSGIRISKDLVLTAAHNFIGIQLSSLEARFYLPSLLPSSIQHQRGIQIQSVFFDANFHIRKEMSQFTVKDIEFDYALVKLKLENPQQEYESQLQLSVFCSQCNSSKIYGPKKINLFGFPNSLNNIDMEKFTLSMCGIRRQIQIQQIKIKQNDAAYAVGYKIKSEVGQSGASLLIGKTVIAIHCLGPKQQNVNRNEKSSRKIGRLITVDMIQNLLKWCKISNAHPFTFPSKLDCQCIDKYSKQLQAIQKCFFQKQKKLVDAQYKESIYMVSKMLKNFRPNINDLSLKQLKLSDNLLEHIDVSKYSSLKTLVINNNKLTAISVKNNPFLEKLNACKNKIKQIDLNNNKLLIQVNLNSNKLQNLSMLYNKKLTQLLASENMITNVKLQVQDITEFEILVANQTSQSCNIIIYYTLSRQRQSSYRLKQEQFLSTFKKMYGQKGGLNQSSCKYTIQMKNTITDDRTIRKQ